MQSPPLSGFGRFPGVCRKSLRWRNRFRRLWNVIESLAKIASFSKSTCRRLHRWIECWIAFSFMGKRPRRLFNHRPCRPDRRLFQKRPSAVAQNVRDSIDDLKSAFEAIQVDRALRRAMLEVTPEDRHLACFGRWASCLPKRRRLEAR